MPRVLFTADLHAGHAGIIAMAQRPFANVDDMDRALVVGWNSVARKDDTVWVVGDFAHKLADIKRLRALFGCLNGIKSLIIGNHDGAETLSLPWHRAVPVAEIVADGQRCWLSHYAHRVWPGQHRGAWQLYGTSHGRLSGSSLSCDVGVDAWGFAPVSVAQIGERLAELPPPESDGDDIECAGGMTPSGASYFAPRSRRSSCWRETSAILSREASTSTTRRRDRISAACFSG